MATQEQFFLGYPVINQILALLKKCFEKGAKKTRQISQQRIQGKRGGGGGGGPLRDLKPLATQLVLFCTSCTILYYFEISNIY